MRAKFETVTGGSSAMIAFLKRYFARRRLRPIVGALPRRLSKAFGTQEHYTLRQAQRVIADLELGKALDPYALATACRIEELEKGGVQLSRDVYDRLREELADVFDLRNSRFTVKDLLRTHHSSHEPPQDSGGEIMPNQRESGWS